MTDRERLELAAKAAGIDLTGWTWTELSFAIDYECPDPDVGRYWNPLTDDGDALRLAVKLNIMVGTNQDTQCAHAYWWQAADEPWDEHKDVSEACGSDPCAAARRAIVRAAAAIGEAMP